MTPLLNAIDRALESLADDLFGPLSYACAENTIEQH
jgi:hypothetical protein